jgi:hypothetical protein
MGTLNEKDGRPRLEGDSTRIMAPSDLPVCSQKSRLIDEIFQAHKRIASIQIAMTEAVVTGKDGDAMLETALNQARAMRCLLVDQLTQHIEDHQC